MNNVIIFLLLIVSITFGQRDRDRDARNPVAAGATSDESGKDAVINKYDFHLGENGEYDFAFESSDGTSRQEVGLIEKSENEENLVVRGSYSFIDSTGKQILVNYIADKDGYRIVNDNVITPSTRSETGPRTAQQNRPRVSEPNRSY